MPNEELILDFKHPLPVIVRDGEVWVSKRALDHGLKETLGKPEIVTTQGLANAHGFHEDRKKLWLTVKEIGASARLMPAGNGYFLHLNYVASYASKCGLRIKAAETLEGEIRRCIVVARDAKRKAAEKEAAEATKPPPAPLPLEQQVPMLRSEVARERELRIRSEDALKEMIRLLTVRVEDLEKAMKVWPKTTA